MKDKLAIFACNSLAAEVSHVLQTGNYPDVKLFSYPISCAGSPLNNERILALTSKKEEYSNILFFVSACHNKKGKTHTLPSKIKLIALEQCFELILNKEIIYHFIKQGYYIISNGWLRNYKHHIAEWGFKDESAKVFFGESLNKILFLDTGIDKDYLPKLISISEYMGLQYEIFPVGLSHCRNFIDSEVSGWRAEKERKYINESLAKLTKENADYFFVFQHLQKLVDYTDETIIVNEVFSLLNILFAPQQIGFLIYNGGQVLNTVWLNSNSTNQQKTQEDFMAIEIVHQNEILGIFEIYGIKFPEYIEQYGKIKPVISKICGVSISNARKYSELEDVKLAISESEDRYKLITQNTLDIIFMIDKTGKQLFFNHSVEKILGYKQEELIGKTFTRFVPKSEMPKYLLQLKNVFLKKEIRNFITKAYHKNGNLIDVEINGKLVRHCGKLVALGTIRDISTRIKHELIIHQKNEELSHANATKDKFFSIIAHDLKSPFNSIVGYGGLLVDQIRNNNYSGIEKYAQIIQQSSLSAMDLLTNLMDWSLSQTGRMEFNPDYVEMEELINDVSNLLSHIAQHKSIKTTKSHLASGIVYADKDMVNTVLRNLITNAIKFTHTGGEIIISTLEKQEELTISVQDNGVGISKDRIEKIFQIDEGYSTPGTNKEKGTGLGLILCKEFVEKHSGKIWVVSNHNSSENGSTFYFTLPMQKKEIE